MLSRLGVLLGLGCCAMTAPIVDEDALASGFPLLSRWLDEDGALIRLNRSEPFDFSVVVSCRRKFWHAETLELFEEGVVFLTVAGKLDAAYQRIEWETGRTWLRYESTSMQAFAGWGEGPDHVFRGLWHGYNMRLTDMGLAPAMWMDQDTGIGVVRCVRCTRLSRLRRGVLAPAPSAPGVLCPTRGHRIRQQSKSGWATETGRFVNGPPAPFPCCPTNTRSRQPLGLHARRQRSTC